MLESSTQRSIWAAVAALAILFRANSGKAWLCHGKPERRADGSIVLPAGRPVALGLALASGEPVAGQADLIGWRSVVIPPEWVGRRVAVFVGIECKRSDGTGRASERQLNFIDQVQAAGGIAGVAHTPAVAQALLRDWVPPVA